jgi:hypothetical protein
MPEAARVVGVSPSDSTVVLAGTDTGVYVSRDGGATWLMSMAGMHLPSGISGFVTSPGLPTHVFALTTTGLYASTDNGGHWVPAGAGLPSCGGCSVSSLVIDPSPSPVMLYATATPDGILYRSGNFGTSWVLAATQPPAPGYHGVRRLALGPGTPSALFAGGTSSWYRTGDGGTSWTQLDQNPGFFFALDARTVLAGRDPAPDGVVTGVDLDGVAIVHATPIGGTSTDELDAVAIDPAGDLVVTGHTNSSDVPVVNALQPTFAGQTDWLAAKITRDADSDADGLADAWEQQVGLVVGANDAGEDPDGDGATNAEEAARGTHPRGFHTAYLAEGATGAFFETLLAVVNPDPIQTAHAWIRFEDATGAAIRHPLLVPPLGRRTVDVAAVAGLQRAEFGTTVESDLDVAVSRTMRWDRTAYGGHAGQAVGASSRWYFAEGATTAGFQLFYLLDNPNDADAVVHVTWLVAGGRAPIEETDVVSAHSRLTLWVNQIPGLASAEFGARFLTDDATPIVVERAMYLDAAGQTFGAGHVAAGVTSPATEWFVAEGATGSYFDLFLLLANPGAVDAVVDVTYLRPAGSPIVKRYVVPASGRYTIWVDQEDPALTDTAVSARARSANDVPFVMERVMWWPGPTAATWFEAHAAPAARETGTVWVAPDGLIGGSGDAATYLLLANTASAAAQVEVTLVFEDGSRAHAAFTVPALCRTNVSVRDEAWTFDSPADALRFTLGGRFGALVESVGPAAPLVVESAVYWNAPGADGAARAWAAGTSTGAVRIR